MSSNYQMQLPKDSILCVEGDTDTSLYIVESGKLLVCVRKGTQVIPLAYLDAGEYVGELSFFDGMPRSADIIAVEDSVVLKIPSVELTSKFPQWLIRMCKHMTKKTRLYDEVIKSKGIKKRKVESIKPLSIDEQRHFLSLIDPK